MRVSVICTVLNEGTGIRRLLDSLVAQTRRPDEVVIVDGGSRDNTVALLDAYAGRLPLQVLVRPGANISRGRNAAIGAATGDVIASTDAGVWLDPGWLEAIVAPLAADPDRSALFRDSLCPIRAAPWSGPWARPSCPRWKMWRNPSNFLPSSRSVAFRKAAWAGSRRLS